MSLSGFRTSKAPQNAGMKPIKLHDTDKPVSVQSLNRRYWLWRKANAEFPGVALHQYIQPEQIQVFWPRVDGEHRGSGFDHRGCARAWKWAPVCQRAWAHAFFQAPSDRTCQVFCLEVRGFKSSRRCLPSLMRLSVVTLGFAEWDAWCEEVKVPV